MHNTYVDVLFCFAMTQQSNFATGQVPRTDIRKLLPAKLVVAAASQR